MDLLQTQRHTTCKPCETVYHVVGDGIVVQGSPRTCDKVPITARPVVCRSACSMDRPFPGITVPTDSAPAAILQSQNRGQVPHTCKVRHVCHVLSQIRSSSMLHDISLSLYASSSKAPAADRAVSLRVAAQRYRLRAARSPSGHPSLPTVPCARYHKIPHSQPPSPSPRPKMTILYCPPSVTCTGPNCDPLAWISHPPFTPKRQAEGESISSEVHMSSGLREMLHAMRHFPHEFASVFDPPVPRDLPPVGVVLLYQLFCFPAIRSSPTRLFLPCCSSLHPLLPCCLPTLQHKPVYPTRSHILSHCPIVVADYPPSDRSRFKRV